MGLFDDVNYEMCCPRKVRQEEGFSLSVLNADDNCEVAENALQTNGRGLFYIVQLLPETLPERIKLGFTTSINDRMRSFRNVSPNAKLIETWSCRRSWESAVRDSITREGCKHVGNEVYDCDSIESIVSRTHEIFNVLPQS